MKLTLLTDYALRVLMYVATKEEGLTTIHEIAEAFDISQTHLMKVVAVKMEVFAWESGRKSLLSARLSGRWRKIWPSSVAWGVRISAESKASAF
jgi:hypothetical protein